MSAALSEAVVQHLGWTGQDDADTIRAHAWTRDQVERHDLVDVLTQQIVRRHCDLDPREVRTSVVCSIWATCPLNADDEVTA